jgi:hypothetical protein
VAKRKEQKKIEAAKLLLSLQPSKEIEDEPVNEIIKNREKNTSYKIKAPTNSDTFALIPIKKGSLNTGELYVDFSGSLQDNKRVYFGPVDIDRMRVKLLDDKGFIVDLHGVDWCITLISENLYQY